MPAPTLARLATRGGAHLRALLGDLADLVAPRACAACGARHPTHPAASPALCPVCADTLLPADEAPPGVFAPYLFGGALSDAIHRAKYGGDHGVARALGALFIEPARELLPARPDLVVPVPLHRKRLAERGFNQSSELARAVAESLRAPLSHGALARVRDTPSQTSLDREARAKNLHAAFRVPAPEVVRYRTILLVDDVVTTGATLASAREALESSGAARVLALALARAPLQHTTTPAGTRSLRAVGGKT